MGNATNLLVLVTAGIALASNPDEVSFKAHMEKLLQRSGSSWIERTLISQVSTLVYKRKDYKFFSLFVIPETETVYLGVFGIWIGLPLYLKRQS
ncbi:hypothetical protein K493DRAFT_313312 [Basidiobolus meristosporus CBS 931.73]|uniref:Uncharacterized protein n=1 Tax=Basidiobolus meristosporus CBS 931.73 TaxID=1314790 RepID=A0A1Y1YMF0_9FUNG|nr:hypothetical protein K493DRAFT_313312 [Basidiobolus meristosporus CBS 931.73]|eukprot:ORX99158.1 hypothetical protein K493DRAFT_313312 [Basidiobolus meristosporus CBS 931.73]